MKQKGFFDENNRLEDLSKWWCMGQLKRPFQIRWLVKRNVERIPWVSNSIIYPG